MSPKCYFAINNDDDNDRTKYKRGSKGIPHSHELTMTEFVGRLYGSESHFVTIRSLRLNRDKQMSRFTLRKRGLSDIFLKFDVASDGITCSPLRKKGKIL